MSDETENTNPGSQPVSEEKPKLIISDAKVFRERTRYRVCFFPLIGGLKTVDNRATEPTSDEILKLAEEHGEGDYVIYDNSKKFGSSIIKELHVISDQ